MHRVLRLRVRGKWLRSLSLTCAQHEQGLPGVKGPRGLKGGWTVIDAMKKCTELGGKIYLGICLKSQRLDSNADTVPFKCKPYQVPNATAHELNPKPET